VSREGASGFLSAVNVATLLFFVANGIAIVAMPPYLRDLGISSEAAIGAVVSTAFFVSVVLRPIGGFLGDRVGYVKLMRLGVFFAVMAQVMYLVHNVATVVVGRLFHGAAIATFLPASIAASVREGVSSLASRSLAVGIGNVLGPLVGSLAYDAGGAPVSFLLAASLHGVNSVLIGRAPPPSSTGTSIGGRLERRVLAFMLLLTVFAISYMSISTFVPVKLKDRGLPIAFWGAFSSTAAVASLIPRVFLARSPSHINYAVAAVATAAASVGLYLATLAEDLPSFVLAGVIYGLGQGAVVTTYQVLALAGSRAAGLSSAVYTMGWDLGSIVGPAAAGWVVERAGFSALQLTPFLLLANVVALTLLYALRSR